ncbi:hypothetical protein ACIF8T_07210 [Streptomyces sp. NPDC085946]|uniref:hypothetical protein n=1 Tax=Streptomyces sp. NPDC085946 TaxID=3365744 RepID=UPI0037CE69E6
MTHVAPVRGAIRGPDRTDDVFGARVHRAAAWAAPLALGLVYGYWAAANRRDGGPVTGWNVLFGFVTAVAFMVLYAAVRALAARLTDEPHALLWSAFTGCACGFLIAQSDRTVLWSALVSLVIAAGVFGALFYRFATHGDARDRRTG